MTLHLPLLYFSESKNTARPAQIKTNHQTFVCCIFGWCEGSSQIHKMAFLLQNIFQFSKSILIPKYIIVSSFYTCSINFFGTSVYRLQWKIVSHWEENLLTCLINVQTFTIKLCFLLISWQSHNK